MKARGLGKAVTFFVPKVANFTKPVFETLGAQMPKSYFYAFTLFTFLASIPAAFLLFVGFYNLSYSHIFFWGGFLFLIWIAFLGLKKNKLKYMYSTFFVIACVWILLLLRTIQRIEFVLENGGMERADGYGSPLAFLIGVVFEQIFFIPACFVVFFGAKYFLSLFQAKRNVS